MRIYYNEWDKPTAAWLRELGTGCHLPSGHVDTRSIRDVRPDDLAGYEQCHFFSGIGGWPLALRLAGYENLPCWTGSPPCQPFSIAGQQRGTEDERHLAPVWLDLIRECLPSMLFGEQVADAIGKGWLDDLFDALEREGYACGAAVLPACSVGAPHIRKRLFFGAVRLADADERQRGRFADGQRRQPYGAQTGRIKGNGIAQSGGIVHGMADTNQNGCEPGREIRSVRTEHDAEHGSTESGMANTTGIGWNGRGASQARNEPGSIERSDGLCNAGGVANTNNTRPQGRTGMSERADEQSSGARGMEGRSANPHHSFWSGSDWLGCRDGKFRPVEPFPQQVVDGFSCGLGSMCDHVAQEIIKDIENATETYSGAEQAVRDLWMQYAAEAVQWPSGRLISFQSPQVLLALMRELTRKGWKLGNHLLPTCWESAEDGLREMRRSPLASPRSPYIGGPLRQPISEPPNTLSVLSQAISYAARKWAVNRDPLNMEADKRDHRVGRLRGYGNAIVPSVAAVFIQEFLDAFAEVRENTGD